MPAKAKKKTVRPPSGIRTRAGRVHVKKSAKVIDIGQAAKKKKREIRIGAQLRHARLTKDFSLRQLAEAVGCSESFVSKIENNKVRPSIAMLHALCSELDINVGTLFEEPGDGFGDVQVLRQGKRRVIHVDPEWQGKDVTLEQVVPQRAASLLQANILEVAPGGYSDGLIEHSGEEFSYMLAGTLELTIGKETYRLMPGDSVFFRSPLAHGYRNVSNEVARVLWVNTPPTF